MAGRGTRLKARVRLLPELEPVALVVPGRHALGVHAERDGREPLDRGLLRGPVVRRSHERLDGALGGGVEALERRHDLAAREDLDPEPPAAHLLDDLRQPLGRALEDVERRGPGRGHPPLDLRLGDDVRGVDEGGSGGGRHRTACLREEPASFSRHAALLTGLRTTTARWSSARLDPGAAHAVPATAPAAWKPQDGSRLGAGIGTLHWRGPIRPRSKLAMGVVSEPRTSESEEASTAGQGSTGPR